MKGMKPTRELCLRCRPQTGARKSLMGPTPKKDNAANPEAPRIIWGPSSGLELTSSCGAERCSRGLETTGRPTNRRNSVEGSSQVVFELRDGSFARKGSCQCRRYASSQSLEKPSTVLAECPLGRRAFQGYAYGRLLRRLKRSGWCLRANTIVPVGISYRYGVSGLRWILLKSWCSEDVHRWGKIPDVTVSEFVQSSYLSCNEETKKSDSCREQW